MAIRVRVWNEGYSERRWEKIREVYPDGIHGAIAEGLREDPRFEVTTAIFDDDWRGLSQEQLDNTDVLIWWAHMLHREINDEIIERVVQRVQDGMGLILLHSAHNSKLFKRLMGTPCRFKAWEKDDHERIFTINPAHPIAEGVPEYFELPKEETYCETFGIPAPDDIVFLGWFSGGAVLRCGCCFHHIAGKIFYFQPGHEEYPIFYDPNVRQIIRNACAWAAPCGHSPVYGFRDPFEQPENENKE